MSPIYFQAGWSLRWDSASLCQSITLFWLSSRKLPPGPFLGLSGGSVKSPISLPGESGAEALHKQEAVPFTSPQGLAKGVVADDCLDGLV